MDKIKAINPQIVVNGNVDKPYYSIEYYDTSDNNWHIGYGSYELKNVIEWLKTDFDIIKTDVEPVVRCKDCKWYKESKLLAPNKFCFRLKDINGIPIGYNFSPNEFCSFGERKENENGKDF